MKDELRRLNVNNQKLDNQIGYMQQVIENSDEGFDSNTAEGVLRDMEDTLAEYRQLFGDIEEETM